MKRDHPFHRDFQQTVNAKELTEEIARPSLTSIRQVWTSSVVANGLTRQKLAGILQAAETGQHHEQLELAEAMEVRDTHFGSVRALSRRDLARLGKNGPDDAPALNEREVDVKGQGLQRVPEGIDPGWAYNVGKAHSGQLLPMAEWIKAKAALKGQSNWEPVLTATAASWGRPAHVPKSPLPVLSMRIFWAGTQTRSAPSFYRCSSTQ